MSEQSIPNSQDLVLGGKLPLPVASCVLGGLAGLNQRFEQSELEPRIAALTEAAKYGEEGVLLLRRGLEDDDLGVRLHAYEQLKTLGETSIAA